VAETQTKWQQTVRGESDAEVADALIETIDDFLQEDPHEVLRQVTSELILSLRAIRHFSQKVQYECNPQIKEMLLFEADNNTPITVQGFTQSVLDQIAEGYELTKLLAFYAIALSEQQK
jgi:hypothetical protein